METTTYSLPVEDERYAETLGIVGHAEEKFTPTLAQHLREVVIPWLLHERIPNLVVSGASPMGGVDVWAVEAATNLGYPTEEFAPEVNRWEGGTKIGFKQRNLQIVAASDEVVCIVVNELPPNFKGMQFKNCYHCARHSDGPPPHVKSGGCWTAWEALRRGKKATWIIVNQLTNNQ